MRHPFRSFVVYWERVLVHAFQSSKTWARDLLIAAILTLIIAVIQTHWGLIKLSDLSATRMSIVLPYAVLLGGYVLWHIVKAPWKLDEAKQDALDAAKEENLAAHRKSLEDHANSTSERLTEIANLKAANAMEISTLNAAHTSEVQTLSDKVSSLQSELDKGPDMQGVAYIEILKYSPFEDQSKPGSGLLYHYEVTNHGRKPCLIMTAGIKASVVNYNFEEPVGDRKPTGENEQFIWRGRLCFRGVCPEDLAKATFTMWLKDSRDNSYPVVTKVIAALPSIGPPLSPAQGPGWSMGSALYGLSSQG
jgi:hypothetical protein